MSTLKYILRHGWFWPVEFWLRPFAVSARVETNEWGEFLSSLTGSILTGAFVGFLFWIIGITNLEMIFAIIGIITGSTIVGFTSYTNEESISFITFSKIIIEFFLISIIFIFNEKSLNFSTIEILFIFQSYILGREISFFMISYDNEISRIIKLAKLHLTYYVSKGKILHALLLSFSSLSIVSIYFILHSTRHDHLNINLLFIKSALSGTITCILHIAVSFLSKFNNNINLSISVSFWILSLLIWTTSFLVSIKKIYVLISVLFIIPFIGSGFLFYPFLLPYTYFLYHPARIQHHIRPLSTPLISFWQSLFLPLPKLKYYLALIAERNISLGYETLRNVQTKSYQDYAASKAAQLVLNGREGLAFAGYLVINTNPATLCQLLLGPALPRSVATLTVFTQEKIKEKDVLLSMYDSFRNSKKTTSEHPSPCQTPCRCSLRPRPKPRMYREGGIRRTAQRT